MVAFHIAGVENIARWAKTVPEKARYTVLCLQCWNGLSSAEI